MAKTALEKQLEKQMRQEKQLADRKRRDEQKRAREEDRMARKEAIQLRAASIVNGQPLIEGFRVMDATAEDALACLLQCERGEGNHVNFEDSIFPDYIEMNISLELEKLIQYGMIGNLIDFNGGGILCLLPPALSYLKDKEAALDRQRQHREKNAVQNITNYGNLVFGNVSGSTFSVDNSIHEIERIIDEKGGEDKDDLYEILDELKELIENINTSRSIPKQKKLFQRITDHAAKHGWFYGAVIQLLGTAVMSGLGG